MYLELVLTWLWMISVILPFTMAAGLLVWIKLFHMMLHGPYLVVWSCVREKLLETSVFIRPRCISTKLKHQRTCSKIRRCPCVIWKSCYLLGSQSSVLASGIPLRPFLASSPHGWNTHDKNQGLWLVSCFVFFLWGPTTPLLDKYMET